MLKQLWNIIIIIVVVYRPLAMLRTGWTFPPNVRCSVFMLQQLGRLQGVLLVDHVPNWYLGWWVWHRRHVTLWHFSPSEHVLFEELMFIMSNSDSDDGRWCWNDIIFWQDDDLNMTLEAEFSQCRMLLQTILPRAASIYTTDYYVDIVEVNVADSHSLIHCNQCKKNCSVYLLNMSETYKPAKK